MTSETPLLLQAREAMGIPELEAFQDQLREAASRNRAPDTGELYGPIARQILDSRTVPDDLGGTLAAAYRAREAAGHAAQALQRAQGLLSAQIGEQHRSKADVGLRCLAGQLDALVEQAREVVELLPTNVTSAQAAIEHDAVDPWRQAVEVVERHRELREAQMIITSVGMARRGTTNSAADHISAVARVMVETAGTVREPELLVPSIREDARLRHGRATGTEGHALSDAHTTRKHNRDVAELPWTTTNPAEMVHLLAHEELWVPSIAALRAAFEDLIAVDPEPEMTPAEQNEAWEQMGRPNPRRSLIAPRTMLT